MNNRLNRALPGLCYGEIRGWWRTVAFCVSITHIGENEL